MLFLAFMGQTGLSHDIFFKFTLWPFEVKWQSMLNFEVATSKLFNCSWKFGSSPRKGRVALCMTNGSNVLIYLTLLYSIFYCTLVSNAKGKIAKSNKSELWNRLPKWELKKKYHGIIPFVPWMLRIASVFLCAIFLGLAWTFRW